MSRALRLVSLVILIALLLPSAALAQAPVVNAVLFYSPTCAHCKTVIQEILPPLFESYGDQLSIIGIDVEYIPHEGGGPATLAFLGKNAEVLVGNVSEVVQHIEAKKMVPVAVASDKRSPIFPEVPTLKEKGSDVVMVQWRSVLAPKGTPAPRVAMLADAFQKAMATESWKTFNRNAKAVDAFLGPADFRKFLASEEERFGRIIDQLGLRKR